MCPSPRIAFFGGSFDPPHLGHLAVARAAQAALRLDRVLFAPVGAQPLKPEGASASFPDRAAMTRLAIEGEPGFKLSLLDAPRPDSSPNYTLETLHALRDEFPEAELFLLLGADSLAQLRNWHGAAEIPFAASLVIASRPGQSLDNLTSLIPEGLSLTAAPRDASGHATGYATGHALGETGADPELLAATLSNAAGQTAPFYLLPGLYVNISASQIRAQTRAGAPSPLLPAVAEYIRRHHLYQHL
jgi:nicotinate-nucleotide adenylyltransferase